MVSVCFWCPWVSFRVVQKRFLDDFALFLVSLGVILDDSKNLFFNVCFDLVVIWGDLGLPKLVLRMVQICFRCHLVSRKVAQDVFLNVAALF